LNQDDVNHLREWLRSHTVGNTLGLARALEPIRQRQDAERQKLRRFFAPLGKASDGDLRRWWNYMTLKTSITGGASIKHALESFFSPVISPNVDTPFLAQHEKYASFIFFEEQRIIEVTVPPLDHAIYEGYAIVRKDSILLILRSKMDNAPRMISLPRVSFYKAGEEPFYSWLGQSIKGRESAGQSLASPSWKATALKGVVTDTSIPAGSTAIELHGFSLWNDGDELEDILYYVIKRLRGEGRESRKMKTSEPYKFEPPKPDNSPLKFAATDHTIWSHALAGDLVAVEQSISRFPNLIDYANPDTGMTMLHYAAAGDQLGAARFLVDRGASFSLDHFGRYPSLVAINCAANADLIDLLEEAESEYLDKNPPPDV